MNSTIYKNEEDAIEICIATDYSSQYVNFAEQIIWGTEGVKFSMKGLAIDFLRFSKPLFVSLYVKEQLISISVLNHKVLHINGREVDVFYSCLWCTDLNYHSKGYATLMINQLTQYLFENYSNALVYAFVERNNVIGKRVVQKAGFRSFADFNISTAINIYPVANKNCRHLKLHEKAKMLELLNKQYVNRTFNDIMYSFDEHDYYVYSEGDTIYAGMQVKKMHWDLKWIDGIKGYILFNIYRKISFLKKYFDPTEFIYISIGNIYFNDKHAFKKLLNAIMHQYNVNTCLAYGLEDAYIDSQIMNEMQPFVLKNKKASASIYVKSNSISLSSLGRFPFISICDTI